MPYQDCLNGYISALEEHKIPVDNELISYGEPAIKGGYDQMWTLLAKQKKFTAVFAAGDTMAIGAMKALKDLRVPEDCAVVGFDYIDFSS
ncbi:MAG: substrate-binding domain-containing protein [Enterocloster sp.]